MAKQSFVSLLRLLCHVRLLCIGFNVVLVSSSSQASQDIALGHLAKAKREARVRVLGAVGSIRALRIQPPGCELQPQFSPETTFYMVECPEQAKDIELWPESIFPLLHEGEALEGPLGVFVKPGDAKIITLQACSDAHGGGCRTYKLDVHRKGSSEALLSELIVTSGGSDLKLLPPFNPSVSWYRVDVPFASSSTQVVATAAKGGFVSYRSFQSADLHSKSLDVNVPKPKTPWGLEPSNGANLTVKIFVVSADWYGQMRYVLELRRAPNSDASIASIASNVGAPYPVGEAEQHRYMLEVPLGTNEVAISATAADKEAARVTLGGAVGVGYASSVVQVDPAAPYKMMKIEVEAADKVTTKKYVLVVAMSQHSSWAMLSDMVVPGCEGGLVPNFQIDVFDYHCLLKSDVGNMQVIPKVMWMPGFNQQMEIHVQGKVWKSGHVFVQPLKDRKAEVDVVVHAADKIHQAVYRIAAHAQRITEHTTSLRPSTSETPRPTTTALTPTAPKIWKPKKPSRIQVKPRPSSNGGEEPPRGRTWALPRLRLPGLPKPSWRESARWTGIVAASFSFAALLQQHELWSFMCLLKELQFAGISGELAGADTFYAQMVRPFRVFLLQVTLPLDICSSKGGGCEPLQEWRECKASNVVLWLLLLPPLLMLLLLGWWEAASEETLSRHGLLKGIGVRGLRRKLLPMAAH